MGGQAGSPAADASTRHLTTYGASFALRFIGKPGSPGSEFPGHARRRIVLAAPGRISPKPVAGPGPEDPGRLGRQARGGAGHG